MTLTCAPSPLDSQRFGRRVFRATVETDDDVRELETIATREGIALAIVRTATDCTAAVHALEAHGHRLMDTLVYWRGPTDGAGPTPSGVRRATEADRAAVLALADEGFRAYPSGHYFADPRLDREAIAAGYVEWIGRSVAEPSVEVWVATVDDDVVGFISVHLDEPVEMVLSAVAARARGAGVYRRLVDAALATARAHGKPEISVSTHVTTLTTQRAWARAGLLPHRSLYTFHKWYAP